MLVSSTMSAVWFGKRAPAESSAPARWRARAARRQQRPGGVDGRVRHLRPERRAARAVVARIHAALALEREALLLHVVQADARAAQAARLQLGERREERVLLLGRVADAGVGALYAQPRGGAPSPRQRADSPSTTEPACVYLHALVRKFEDLPQPLAVGDDLARAARRARDDGNRLGVAREQPLALGEQRVEVHDAAVRRDSARRAESRPTSIAWRTMICMNSVASRRRSSSSRCSSVIGARRELVEREPERRDGRLEVVRGARDVHLFVLDRFLLEQSRHGDLLEARARPAAAEGPESAASRRASADILCRPGRAGAGTSRAAPFWTATSDPRGGAFAPRRAAARGRQPRRRRSSRPGP